MEVYGCCRVPPESLLWIALIYRLSFQAIRVRAPEPGCFLIAFEMQRSLFSSQADPTLPDCASRQANVLLIKGERHHSTRQRAATRPRVRVKNTQMPLPESKARLRLVEISSRSPKRLLAIGGPPVAEVDRLGEAGAGRAHRGDWRGRRRSRRLLL